MRVVERMDSKLDDIRDTIHEIALQASNTMIRQTAQEKEIETLQKKVGELEEAYHKATGAWKLLSLPGIVSLLYAISQFLQK